MKPMTFLLLLISAMFLALALAEPSNAGNIYHLNRGEGQRPVRALQDVVYIKVDPGLHQFNPQVLPIIDQINSLPLSVKIEYVLGEIPEDVPAFVNMTFEPMSGSFRLGQTIRSLSTQGYTIKNSRIRINSTYSPSLEPIKDIIIPNTVVHEILHALGIQHSSRYGTIVERPLMSSSVKMDRVGLTNDDINALLELYGPESKTRLQVNITSELEQTLTLVPKKTKNKHKGILKLYNNRINSVQNPPVFTNIQRGTYVLMVGDKFVCRRNKLCDNKRKAKKIRVRKKLDKELTLQL